MTVSYTAEVVTGSRGFGNFFRLLFRWTGGIFKLLLTDLAVYLVLFYCINLPYRFWISKMEYPNNKGKIYFHKFVKYARNASGLIPLQFILGFYVSQVGTRWWSQFMTIPWPDTIAVTVASAIRGTDDRGRLMRRTILRYINTSLCMVFTMISSQAQTRFPSLDNFVDGGFLVPHERGIIDILNEKTPGPKYYVPIVWAGAVAVRARKENRIQDDMALYQVLKEIFKFRNMAGDLLSYDWVNIPLVYTQVATLATYAYFLSSLIGRQMLDDPDEIDMYIPFFLILEFVFMLGWLKVAEAMINPFGLDDDDFEVNWLIDRNLTVSYMIADEMKNECPEMEKDIFWEGGIPEELKYTPEALRFKTDGMGGGSAAIKEEQDQVSQKGDAKSSTSGVKRASMPPDRSRSSHREDPEGRQQDDPSTIGSKEFLGKFLESENKPEYKDTYENVQER